MNSPWLPWVKLAGAWVTAVVVCLATVVILLWQTSGPMGRRGQIEEQIEDLSREIMSLERTVSLAAEERVVVAETGAEIDRISGEIFGNLEERLTSVLREVGMISRNSGLIPVGFSYQVRREEKSGGVRFGIGFSVEGTYSQVRQLLAGLQNSNQFLIIDGISFKGEDDPRSQSLAIGLQVSTFLADAEPEELRALINILKIDDVVLEEAMGEPPPASVEGDDEIFSGDEAAPDEVAAEDLSVEVELQATPSAQAGLEEEAP